MKLFVKLVFVILLFIHCDKTQAQSYAEYRGIPVKGKVERFCAKLSDLGLKDVNSDLSKELFSSDYVYLGEYLRREMIHVVKCDDMENVEMLLLYYFCDGVSIIESEYKNFVRIFTMKYGEPIDGYYNCLEQGFASWIFKKGMIGINYTDAHVLIGFISSKHWRDNPSNLMKNL